MEASVGQGAPARAQLTDESTSGAGALYPLQDVIERTRHALTDDALSHRGQRASHAWTIEPLPKEVIDYDNGLPLLAGPGMDRRRQTPESIRRAMQQAWAGVSVDAAEAAGAAAHPTDVFEAPIRSHAVSPDKPEAPAQPEPADESGDAGDLSHFLDFTPPESPGPAAPAGTTEDSGSLSGPSFLGLSGDAEASEGEPEPAPRRWPRYLVSGFIAVIAAMTLMHGTSLRETALRYARVGASYAQMLRSGKADSSTGKAGAQAAAASPTPNQTTTPDFVVEQRPQNPEPPARGATSGAEAGAQATPAPASASEAKAPAASATPAAVAGASAEQAPSPSRAIAQPPVAQPAAASSSTPASPAGSKTAGSGEPKQTADSRPPAKQQPIQPKPSAQQNHSAGPIAGQAEYQQALAANNPEVARALLWRATALGNPDAPVNLADIYIYGQGVPQNCEQGLVLLRSAAQKANPRAQGKLGALYATGKCVALDRVQAYRWLSLALNHNQGSEWVEQNRDMVWRQMSPAERSRVTSTISTR